MIDCISMSCPNCGAKLEVAHDGERLACGHCGTESMVRRRGGAVSLRPVVEAIRRVQSGTDRTAAELAIARLRHDQEAVKAKQAARHAATRGETVALLFGLGFAFIGLIVLATDSPGARESRSGAIGFIVIGAFAFVAAFRTAGHRRAEERRLDAQWQQIERQIRRQIDIAEGRSTPDDSSASG